MNEAWIEKTEQYFNNEMSTEEKLLFESEMRTNDELSSYFNLYKEIETAMRTEQKNNEEEAALRTSLNKLNTIYFKKEDINIAANTKELTTQRSEAIQAKRQNNKQRTIKMQSVIAVAAAITGIVILSVFLYLGNSKKNSAVAVNSKGTDTVTAAKHDEDLSQKKTSSPDLAAQNNADTNTANKQVYTLTKKRQLELFRNNFKPDDAPEITEGPLEDAFTYYAKRNYADAAEEFNTADINSSTRGLETDPKLTAFYADYYAGLSYLAQGQTTSAITKLKGAENKATDNVFKIKAEWYLSLAWLKTGEIKKANTLLTKISISSKENIYKLKADNLLNELRQP